MDPWRSPWGREQPTSSARWDRISSCRFHWERLRATPDAPTMMPTPGRRTWSLKPSVGRVDLASLILRRPDSTFQPSTISVLLADALEVHQGDEVIDVGCGSGILSIIAAKLGALRVRNGHGTRRRWSRSPATPPATASRTPSPSCTAICSLLFSPGGAGRRDHRRRLRDPGFPGRGERLVSEHCRRRTAGLWSCRSGCSERRLSASAGGRLFLPTALSRTRGRSCGRPARSTGRSPRPTERQIPLPSAFLAETSALQSSPRRRPCGWPSENEDSCGPPAPGSAHRRDSRSNLLPSLSGEGHSWMEVRFFGEEQPWLHAPSRLDSRGSTDTQPGSPAPNNCLRPCPRQIPGTREEVVDTPRMSAPRLRLCWPVSQVAGVLALSTRIVRPAGGMGRVTRHSTAHHRAGERTRTPPPTPPGTGSFRA